VSQPLLSGNDDESLLAVAVAIADGSAIDWADATGADSSADAAAVLAGLKSLERLVRGHEELRSAAPDPAADTVMTAARRESGFHTPLDVRWGPLVILDKIGRGSFGDVYRAWDPRLEREVALKLIPERAPESVSSPVVEEGRLLARVRHPNVLTVHGAERIDGRAGIWTEYVRGETLAAEIARRGPVPADEAARIGIEICRALQAVHGAGLLHRDVKAQNILRDSTGRLVLGDFGTGVAIDDQAAVASPQIAGTPLYLAPELLAGEPATVASDLYSVGVLLYFLVTGDYPVRGRTMAEVKQAHAAGQRAPMRRAGAALPESFVEIVEALLAPGREHRFPDASAVESALTQSLAPKRRPRAWIAGGVTAAIALVALLVSFASSTGPAAATVSAGDWVLVAGIDNQTGEATFDRAVEAALKRELEYSEHIRVAQRDRWEDALELLGRPIDTRLDAALARQVSLLDGSIRRVIAGAVRRNEQRDTLTILVVDPASGATLETVTESAERNQMAAALRRGALRLRAALGEPEAALAKARTELERTTAPSLEALSFHAGGLARGDVRNGATTVTQRNERWAAVERLERRAIEADPAFGDAWIMLAWALRNQGRPGEDYLPMAQRAAELTGSATPQERYFIEGSLHTMRATRINADGTDNSQELEQAVRAYEALLALQPDHYYVRNNLTVAYNQLGRSRDLAQLNIRLADARPASIFLNAQAVGHLIDSDNLEAARRYAARAEAAAALKDDGRDLISQSHAELSRAWLDWYEGNMSAALTRATRAEATIDRTPLDSRAPRSRLIFLYLTLGRLKTAQAVAERSRIWETSTPYMLAYALRERGDLDALRTYLTTVWTHDHGSPATTDGWRVEFLVPAGMLDEAARDIERYRRRIPPSAHYFSSFYPFLMGRLEMGRGHPRLVVRQLEPWLATPGRAPVIMNWQGAVQWLARAWTLLGEPGKASRSSRARNGPTPHGPDANPKPSPVVADERAARAVVPSAGAGGTGASGRGPPAKAARRRRSRPSARAGVEVARIGAGRWTGLA
jgi:serine/threonine-protein kinase